jgi:hypothetical protein
MSKMLISYLHTDNNNNNNNNFHKFCIVSKVNYTV